MKSTARKYIRASEWQQHHSWPPKGGLRHLIFNAKRNGFNAVIRRAGRCILIDEGAFFDWVDANGGSK